MNKLKRIRKTVEKYSGVKIKNNKCRARRIVDAKRIYGYIARTVTHKSFFEIGEKINHNHATVMHYCKTAENLISTDKDFNKLYVKCLSSITKNPEEVNLRSRFKHHVKKARFYHQKLKQAV